MVLYADQEHAGVRTAVFVLLFVCVLVSYLLLSLLVNLLNPAGAPDGAFFFTCGGGVVLGLGLAWLGEKLLKRFWHSGRMLTLTDDELRVTNRDAPEMAIAWAEMAGLYWQFSLKGFQRGGRERRVNKDWVCLAVQLLDKEQPVIAYTYLPTQKATSLATAVAPLTFHTINPQDVYESRISSRFNPPERPEIPSRVLAGKDGKYWLAERKRWAAGFELTAVDFQTLITAVHQHLARP